MRDYGIDKGLVEYRDDSKRDQRGWGKGFFGFRKMFRDYLTKLNVAFYDACCPALTGDIFPVRFNAAGGGTLERFNGTTWVTVPLDGAFPTAITVNTINAAGASLGVGGFLTIWSGTGITWAGFTAPFIPASLQQNIPAGLGGAINVTAYFTTINTDAGGDAFTLADGTVVGQLKKIRLLVDGGGDGVVTPTTLFGGDTITFNDAGDEVELMWLGVGGGGWTPIYNVGTTIA